MGVGHGHQQRPRIKSCIREHTQGVHGGAVCPDSGREEYKVKVPERLSKCLQRQVDEDIRMQEFEANGAILLNTTHEYYTPKGKQAVFR